MEENIFFENIAHILNVARENAKTAVNITMVYAYYEIGRTIVEEEQRGKGRAEYGKRMLQGLSEYLTEKFGKGFSVGNLKNIRQFYKTYVSDQIGETVFSQFENIPSVGNGRRFCLSWSHYLFLMRIRNVDARHFYEIESVKNNWSLRELKRQFDTALFERLALSIEKDGVIELSRKGQIIEMGMGKGFTFVGRQVRFTFDEEHFIVDLVLYNRLLRCFVIVDLKVGKLKHQDLGQMQMYVNYYDRYEKSEDENPTIGILLCNEKSDRMVELTLPKDSNVYASKYELYLPDKKLLQEKLIEWLEEENASE